MTKQNHKPAIRFKGFHDDWEEKKLGEMATIIGGGTPDTSCPKYWDGDIDWYAPAELGKQIYVNKSLRRITLLGLQNSSAKILPANRTILFTSRAGIGKMAILTKDATTNQGFQSIVLNDYVVPYFIYSLGFKIKEKAENIAGGSTFLEISGKQLANLNIILPNIKEQTQIGTFFTHLDELISQADSKVEKLLNVKRSMLEKMFPREGCDVPEVRFKGFSEPWERKKLGEVVDFLDTMRKPLEETKRVNGPYPYYGASGIVDYIDDYLFDEELVLLSEDGANILDRNYPVCFLATGKYWVNNHAHVLKPKINNDNCFICNSLERKDYHLFNSGMAMPKLNQEICKNIPISIPQIEEQIQIGNFFAHLDELISQSRERVAKLRRVKQALLEKMFV